MFRFTLLALPLCLFGQVYEEIPLPLSSMIVRIATGTDGLLWLDDQTNSSFRGGQLLVFDVNGRILNSTPFDSPGYARTVHGPSIVASGFYPQDNGGLFDHSLYFAPSGSQSGIVQATSDATKPLCDTFVIDGGKTSIPGLRFSGPFPASDGTAYISASPTISGPINTSLFLLSGSNTATSTCNLTTVLTSSKEIIQAWKLSASTFLAERTVSAGSDIHSPQDNLVTEVALLNNNGTETVQVGTAASKPQILAAVCCYLAFDTVAKTGLVTFLGTDNKTHAKLCGLSGCQTEIFNSDAADSNGRGGLIAADLKGHYALLGGGRQNALVNEIFLVDTTTGTVYPVAKSAVAVNGVAGSPGSYGSIGAVGVDGTVYFVFVESKPVLGQMHLFKLPGPGSTPAVPVPTYSAAEVADAASGKNPPSPGAAMSLYGTNLAVATVSNTDPNGLPTTLGATQLLFNGSPAPLYFLSPGQLNFQVPWEVPIGTANVEVATNGVHGPVITVPVAGSGPGIFANGSYAAMLDAITGQIVGTAETPAKVGSIVSIYVTGLGMTSCHPATGMPNPPKACPALITPSVLFGDAAAEVQYAGLAPNFVGLYQVNVVVPDTPDGTIAVTLDMMGLKAEARSQIGH